MIYNPSMILALGDISSSLASYLLDKGLDFGLLRDKQTHRKLQIDVSKLMFYGEVSFDEFDSVVETSKKIPHPIDAVITDFENYIVVSARLANKLGVNGLPTNAAYKVTDKALMRQAFIEYDPIISPSYAEVDSEEDLLEFARSNSYPMIIKPANLVKSLFVTRVNNEIELINSYNKISNALPDTYSKLNIHRKPKIIIEEFMEGSIHSVDGVIDSDGNITLINSVVDILSGYDVGHKDNYHYSRTIPTELHKNQVEEITSTAKKGIEALGLRSCAAHTELFLTKNGPKIIEIGARTGGYRAKMHRLANGVDYYGALINVLLKKPVDLKLKRRDWVTIIEVFPDTRGVFNSITNYQKLPQLNSFEDSVVHVNKGDIVGLAKHGFKATARIILASNNPEEFAKDFSYIKEQVSVELK